MKNQPEIKDDLIPVCECGQRLIAVKYGSKWLCLICAVKRAEETEAKGRALTNDPIGN